MSLFTNLRPKQRVIDMLRKEYPGTWTYDYHRGFYPWRSATHGAMYFASIGNADLGTYNVYLSVAELLPDGTFKQIATCNHRTEYE